MIELGLGVALGAGVTWLISKLISTGGQVAFRGVVQRGHHDQADSMASVSVPVSGTGGPVVGSLLTKLADASRKLEDLALVCSEQGIRVALDAVASARESLIRSETSRFPDQVAPKRPISDALGNTRWVSLGLAVISLLAGIAGALLTSRWWAAMPSALAGLSAGCLMTVRWFRFPAWCSWASLALLASHVGLTVMWLSGRSDVELGWLSEAFRPWAAGLLALAATCWLSIGFLTGAKMNSVQAWIVWASACLLGAGLARSRSVEEAIPSLLWALVAYGATVGLFSRWAAGARDRSAAFGRMLQSCAVSMAILWSGAMAKGTPWSQLSTIAMAATVVFVARGLAWNSFGWCVTGAFTGCLAILAAGRHLELGTGILLASTCGWLGVHSLAVQACAVRWGERRRQWLDYQSLVALSCLGVPALASLACRCLLLEADWLVELASIAATPAFLASCIPACASAVVALGRFGVVVRDGLVAACLVMFAGWAGGTGAAAALGVMAIGGVALSLLTSGAGRWFAAFLAGLSITFTAILEYLEPSTWPVALQAVSAMAIVTGCVLGIRGSAAWWHLSGLSVVPWAIGLSIGMHGGIPLMIAGLSGGWSALGLFLRVCRFSDGEDRDESPRLAILTASMACSAFCWIQGFGSQTEMPQRYLALAGSLVAWLAATRYGDLARRQVMHLVAMLLAAGHVGILIACAGGHSELALLACAVTAGSGVVGSVALLMFLCHDLSSGCLVMARLSSVFILVAATGSGMEPTIARTALPLTLVLAAALAWLVSLELDRRRRVVAIGWRTMSFFAGAAAVSCASWCVISPENDSLALRRVSMAVFGWCLGLSVVAAVAGGRVSAAWLTRKAAKGALGKTEWIAIGGLLMALVLEGARYSGPGDSAWHGLPTAIALASSFGLFAMSRQLRDGKPRVWSLVLPAFGLLLHLAWTSNRGAEENLGLLHMTSACLVALAAAWHARGLSGSEVLRTAGVGALAVVIGLCLLEARGTSETGPQRAFFSGALSIHDQAGRGLNTLMVLGGLLVACGLTGGPRSLCAGGASLALLSAAARQAVDGQSLFAVVPQALGALAIVMSLIRKEGETPAAVFAGSGGRESRAA
jgi:hypothetical protein